MQLYSCNCQSAFGILFHMADCFVGVVIKHKLLLTCDREKGEHVATGERGDESFFGIDVGRIAQIGRRGRSRHGVAAVEAPGVIARIFLINKFGARALPTPVYFVFGHTFRIRCRFGDRKQPGQSGRATRLERGALRRWELFPSVTSSYLVKSAAVGGPSTQFTSHGPSTVMNVKEFAGSHASWTILAGM